MSRLIQLADLHFGVEDELALAHAAREIERLEPDAIIVCGDLTQRGKTSEFEAAEAWLDRFDYPRLTVPGNHDTPLLDMYTRARRPFARYSQHCGDTSASLETDDAIIVGLNTSRGWQARRNWAEGVVNLDDLADLTEIAGKAPSEKLGVLACHHPFQSPPGAPMRTSTRRGKRASHALANSSIQLLLTGHVHTPSAMVWSEPEGEYLNITSGTLSKRLRNEPPSFNVIDVTSDSIHAWAILTQGKQGEVRELGCWEKDSLKPMSVSTVGPA